MTFKPGALFYGWSNVPMEEEPATLTVKFSVQTDVYPALPEGASMVEPMDVAEALNSLLAAHGWPPITFLGDPADAPLNAAA